VVHHGKDLAENDFREKERHDDGSDDGGNLKEGGVIGDGLGGLWEKEGRGPASAACWEHNHMATALIQNGVQKRERGKRVEAEGHDCKKVVGEPGDTGSPGRGGKSPKHEVNDSTLLLGRHARAGTNACLGNLGGVVGAGVNGRALEKR
jgi:hypothetical protein